MIEMKFDKLTESNNEIIKLHKRHWSLPKKLTQEWALLMLQYKPKKPLDKCHIKVIRSTPSRREQLDWDNFYGGLKCALDAMVVPTKRNPIGIGIIKDDNPRVVLSLVGEQIIGETFTKIIILR